MTKHSFSLSLEDDEKGILLTESLDDSDGGDETVVHQFGCSTIIPRSAIREIWELKRGRNPA